MSNLRIVAENFSDTSTLTAYPEVAAGTDIDNLQALSRSKVVRTTALGESGDFATGVSTVSSRRSANGAYIYTLSFGTPYTLAQFSTNSSDGTTNAAATLDNTINIPSIPTQPKDFQFSEDGTKLYVAFQDTPSTVQTWFLSSPWIISSAVYQAGLDTALTTIIGGFHLNPLGTELITILDIVGSFDIIRYTLSTPFLMSTATKIGSTVNMPGVTGVRDVRLNSAGTRLYTIDAFTTTSIRQFNMTTGYDITTLTNPTIDISGPAASLILSLEINRVNEKVFYIVGTGLDTIYTYNMDVQDSLSTAKLIGNNAQIINSTLLTPQTVSSIILGRHNFPAGTQLQFLMYSDIEYITEVHDSGTLTVSTEEAGGSITAWGDLIWGVTPWGNDALADEFAPDSNYVHWITDVATGVQAIKIIITLTEDVDINRLIIGKYIQPKYNLSFGHSLSWKENTKQFRTEGGTLRSDTGIPRRKIDFSLSTIDSTDRELLQTGMRHVGLRKDFFISLFPEDSDENKKIDYSGIVKLTKVPSTSEFAPLYYKSKYSMEEV